MKHIVDGYELTSLKNEISVKHIISVHYFEYSKNYIFEGEQHDFWELLYVDKGEINVMGDDHQYTLGKGEMIFHKPNQWHNVVANGKVAPNLVVVAFDTRSNAMSFFDDKVLSIDDVIKTHLISIINEAHNAFSSDLSDPMMKGLKKRKHVQFGAEQLIRLNLEWILLQLIRGEELYTTVARTNSNIREYAQEEKLSIIINFLKENVNSRLTLEDICHQTLLSKSSLIKIFKEGMGMSVMEFFKRLKVEEAKTLIREGNHNFTEIATLLGYNSIHYFSRTFKSVTDMTLTEYASSIKMHLEDKG